MIMSYANAYLINYCFSMAEYVMNSSSFNSNGRDERLYGLCMCLAVINIFNTFETQVDGVRNWYFKGSKSIFEIAQAIYDGFLSRDIEKLKKMMAIDYELKDYFKSHKEITLTMNEEEEE
jgi:hypothetical protein